jgi:hypothetical protein
MKIRPVGVELFHADRRTHRQTDMTQLRVAFRNFANGSKNDYSLDKCVIVYCSLSDRHTGTATCLRLRIFIITRRQENKIF